MIYNLFEGEKITIKPLSWINKYYYDVVPHYKDRLFHCYTMDKYLLPFYNNMKIYCGKLVTISKIIYDNRRSVVTFNIEEDNGKNLWDELMIDFSQSYIDKYLVDFCNNRCINNSCSSCPLNYKVGDSFYIGEKVIVKPFLWLRCLYKQLDFYDFLKGPALDSVKKNFYLVNDEMKSYCGKLVTISNIYYNRIKIEEDNGKNIWDDLMFDKININIENKLKEFCNKNNCSSCDNNCPIFQCRVHLKFNPSENP